MIISSDSLNLFSETLYYLKIPKPYIID